MSWWNKSSRTLPRPTGAPLRRRQRARGGGPYGGSLFRSRWPAVHQSTGVSCGSWCSYATGGEAVGDAKLWLVDLGVLAQTSSDPRPWKQGVCPRPMDLNSVVLLVFTGEILLRLLQSFQAMVFPPVSGCWLLPLSGWRHLLRHRFPATAVAGKSGEQGAPQGVLCNFCFFQGLLCKFGWDSCTLYMLRMCTSLYGVLYGVFQVLIQPGIIKKKHQLMH